MGAILLCLVTVIQASVAEGDWPQFRGPTGDGIAVEATPPVRWSETENIRWKVALPGRGAIVAGGAGATESG